MKVFRSFEEFAGLSRHSALAIGNFDGLHLGHQKILKFLVRQAKRQKLLSCVLTFSPHPEKIFGPDKVCMIQTLEQRLEGIENIGVEATLVVPFNRRFEPPPQGLRRKSPGPCRGRPDRHHRREFSLREKARRRYPRPLPVRR